MPQIPPSFNYPNPLRMIPEIGFDLPPEVPNGVDIVLEWGTVVSRGLTAFQLNMQSNATLAFSQICGIVVDNSGCGGDLDFIFPDTDTTLSIPAYAPYTVVPVFTRATELFVRGNGVIAGDKTNFRLLNYSPRPVAVPLTVLQQIASNNSLTLQDDTVGLIGTGINGVVQGININVACPTPSADFNALIQLVDGDGRQLWAGNVAQDNTGPGFNVTMVDLSGLNLRFVGGVELVIDAGGIVPGATIDVNIYYKTVD